MATKQTPNTEPKRTAKEIENENKSLRSELDEMKKMILNLTKPSETKSATVKVIKNEVDEYDDYDDCRIDIPANKYIRIMSLTNNMLVLSTEGYGRGKVFKFNKFGQTKDIVYSELVEIIHNQQSFIEKGNFYIMNKDVIKNHNLIEIYEKILTRKTIENIMTYDAIKIDEIFRSASKSQQDTIVSILISKIKNNQDDIDLNKLDIINKIYGKNIKELAIGRPEEIYE